MSNGLLRGFRTIGLMLALGGSMSACAGLFGNGSTSWKEEVLLHDGSKIIADRSIDRGGRHEIGQQPPAKEIRISFTLLTSNEQITWKSEFSADVGGADLKPLLLDIFQGTAYVVTSPIGCLAYNKWGRPNPPYVIFKYQGKAWQRITMQELPAELNKPNLIISSPDNEVEKMGKRYVTAAMVQAANSDLTQTQFKTILRDEVKGGAGGGCMEEVRTGDGWMSLDWFSSQKTYEACLKICEREKVSAQNCPCNKLFKGEK